MVICSLFVCLCLFVDWSVCWLDSWLIGNPENRGDNASSESKYSLTDGLCDAMRCGAVQCGVMQYDAMLDERGGKKKKKNLMHLSFPGNDSGPKKRGVVRPVHFFFLKRIKLGG
ncbi:hypothetical protein F5Y14DRAFT_415176 [Nemania sp. NC0429]|nr:hypothetical protein F5Y14DRAFT_415176 [Nemania sp. NC0429]